MTLGGDPGADSYVPGHGDTGYDAVHYDLTLEYDVEGNRLAGTATIHCVANEDLTELGFDLHGLDVSKALLDRQAVKHRTRRGRVTLRPADPVAEGEGFTVRFRYSGHPRPVRTRRLGTAGWEELTDGSIVAGQPHGAPSWFPCNDRPSNKATYEITVTAPNGYRVVANGALVKRRRRSGAVSWRYEQDEPMASYLATVHVGRYEVRTMRAAVPMSVVLPQRLVRRYADTFGGQPEMVETFSRLFGPYPFSSYTVVITDDDLEMPLEAQGLSTFGANSLRPGWDAERLVAHELAHQWFGNSLTLAHWKDIWLHEGFACYAEWLWSEQSGRRSAQEHAVEHHARLASSEQDVVLGDPGPELMFDDRIYKRGALLLHTLRCTLGDDTFFDLLRTWTHSCAHSSVTTEDFVEHVSAATTTDLTELFDSWLNREELPALRACP